LQKESNNGWTFWYVIRDNKLLSIDELRQYYGNNFLNKNLYI